MSYGYNNYVEKHGLEDAYHKLYLLIDFRKKVGRNLKPALDCRIDELKRNIRANNRPIFSWNRHRLPDRTIYVDDNIMIVKRFITSYFLEKDDKSFIIDWYKLMFPEEYEYAYRVQPFKLGDDWCVYITLSLDPEYRRGL